MKITFAELATLVSGRLFVPIGRLYELYNELLNDNLFTHQLPGAHRFVEPFAATKYPEIRDAIEKTETNPENYLEKLALLRAKFGDDFELTVEGWESRDPLTELVEMVGKDRIAVVEVPEDRT